MKKLFIVLFAAIAILAFIFIRQIQRARSIVTTMSDTPLVSLESYPIALPSATPFLGNPGASLTIVAFVDLNDDASKEMFQTLAQFVTAHPQDARLAWEDFPGTSIFSGAHTAPHIAAWCAGEQNRFWEFINMLAQDKRKLNDAELIAAATKLKLNVPAWQECMASGKFSGAVAQGVELGATLGIEKAPALFVNNKRINVASDVDLKQMLANFIAK